MPPNHFDLVSQWCIHAPVERVWPALVHCAGWPIWWPCVRSVRVLRDGRFDGVGARCRIEWATRFPFLTVVEWEGMESVHHQRLRGRSWGHLHGEGLWLLRDEAGTTHVTHVWRLSLPRPWMRWFTPWVAWAWRWNHAAVMRAGELGLRHHLGPAPRLPAQR